MTLPSPIWAPPNQNHENAQPCSGFPLTEPSEVHIQPTFVPPIVSTSLQLQPSVSWSVRKKVPQPDHTRAQWRLPLCCFLPWAASVCLSVWERAAIPSWWTSEGFFQLDFPVPLRESLALSFEPIYALILPRLCQPKYLKYTHGNQLISIHKNNISIWQICLTAELQKN